MELQTKSGDPAAVDAELGSRAGDLEAGEVLGAGGEGVFHIVAGDRHVDTKGFGCPHAGER